MAAAQAAWITYMTDTLGIDAPIRDAIIAEGVTNITDLATLSDDEVKSICTNIRKPGGTTENPVYVAAVAAGGAAAVDVNIPQRIPNPGIAVPLPKEKLLRQVAYLGAHFKKIQRAFNTGSATIARLNAMWLYKTRVEEEDNDVDLPDKLVKVDNIRQVLENIDHYLRTKRGVHGSPLAYITRPLEGLPANDPGFATPSIDEELIDRTEHAGDTFTTDNAAVWSVIRHVTHDGPGWNWVSSHARRLNGRNAYFALRSHYMGTSYEQLMKSNADKILETAYYDGRSRNFTFESYSERLNRAFTDLAEVGEDVPQDRQVRIFLKGIRAPNLQVPKSVVMSNSTLRSSFILARDYLSEFKNETENIESAARGRSINAVNSSGRGGGRSSGRGRGGRHSSRGGRGRGDGRGGRSGRSGGRGRSSVDDMTDRYYPPHEWDTLTHEQQQRVRDLRADRDRRRGVVAATNTRNTRPRYDNNSPNPVPTAPAPAPSQGIGGLVNSPRYDANGNIIP